MSARDRPLAHCRAALRAPTLRAMASRGPLTAALALVAAAVAAAPAGAAVPIRATALVARSAELPGFHHSRYLLRATTSAFEWARATNHGTSTRAQAQARTLRRLGFQEGVAAYFAAGARLRGGAYTREAVSETLVLADAADAQQALAAAVAESLTAYGPVGLLRAPDPQIPGAVTIGNLLPGGRGGASANVFFVRGRCMAVVGDGIDGARSRAPAERAPLAAALALYARLAAPCA